MPNPTLQQMQPLPEWDLVLSAAARLQGILRAATNETRSKQPAPILLC